MVKLTIKTVQNKVFNVEAGENESIADVKNKIKDAQGFAVEAQKIIYAGECREEKAAERHRRLTRE